jgi:hypothetical protein
MNIARHVGWPSGTGALSKAVAALMIALGVGVCPGATVAQNENRALVVGRWEGRITFGESAPAVLEFSEAGGALVWKYSYKYDLNLWGDAAGTVTSFSPPALELAGAWTKHAVPGAAGTTVRFALTIDGDRLNGTVTAEMNNTPVTVSLVRKK